MSASASKEIRSITYSNLATESQFSNKKWRPPNDDVFNKLAELVSDEDKIKIADFLNLFYYFIICYSKKCFKKHCIWKSSRYKKNNYSKTKILYNDEIHFNYQLANDYDSHSKILEIQRSMNQYRQEFKLSIDNKITYHSDHTIKAIMLFIEDSLEIICTVVQEPVILISYDIKNKIVKYKNTLENKKKTKKSLKINYAALEAIL
jgi:hypothetical protein